MILFSIFLVFATGLLLLWSFGQHRNINVFEQLALGFGTTLSLFVLELFIQGMVLDHLSLLFPLLTFIGFLLYLSIREWRYGGVFREIRASITQDLKGLRDAWISLGLFKKSLTILIVGYVLFKVFLAFSINVSMPTVDEDAVTGWDMKTRVFAEHKSLVLDKMSPEFLGSALERNIFAPLTDTYFLLGYERFPVGLSNVISPLVYLVGIFLLFGILYRRTDFFMASLGIYIFTSMPFLFVHGIGAYLNYFFGFFLFFITFYLFDQFLSRGSDRNTLILPIIGIWAFLATAVRNEGGAVFGLLSGLLLVYSVFRYWYLQERDAWSYYLLLPIGGVGLGIAVNKIIQAMYPVAVNMNFWSADVSLGVIPKLLHAFSDSSLIFAPVAQAFYHPDYSLIYILFAIALGIMVFRWRNLKDLSGFVVIFFILLAIFLTFLYTTPGLWLLSHFAYVRYTLTLILFIVLLIFEIFYRTFNQAK